MHRHQAFAGRVGSNASGQQRHPDPGRHAGNNGFDRTEFQRFGSKHAKAGQQRVQALAIRAAEAKHHGLQVLDTRDIVQVVQGR
ncbi:hypothetical protein D3C76_1348670 [compost metagenome]